MYKNENVERIKLYNLLSYPRGNMISENKMNSNDFSPLQKEREREREREVEYMCVREGKVSGEKTR